jgi:hypothetical protein
MDDIYRISTSRCGVVEDIRNRFSLVSEFLKFRNTSKIVIVTLQKDQWTSSLDDTEIVFLNPKSSNFVHNPDQIFVDADIPDLSLIMKINIISSSAFVWFFPINFVDEIFKIIKYRLSLAGIYLYQYVDKNIFLKGTNREKKIIINFYFDECISSLKYSIRVQLQSDSQLILNSFCNICFEDKRNTASTSCCKKSLCKDCIVPWFTENDSCPCCRFKFPVILYKPLNSVNLRVNKFDKCIIIGHELERFKRMGVGNIDEFIFCDTLDRKIYGITVDKMLVDAVTFKDNIWDFVNCINCTSVLEIHYII